MTRAVARPGGSRDDSDDATLLGRLAVGDLAALGALYDRHQADVRRFAWRAGGGADTEDLVQEVFLMLPSLASRFDGRASARPFLLGVTARLLHRRRRRLGRLGEVLRQFGTTLTGALPATPERLVGDAEDMALFDSALRALSDEKRLVFVLVESEGLSGAEVAEALQIPTATVWTRLHYARRELRTAIERGRRR